MAWAQKIGIEKLNEILDKSGKSDKIQNGPKIKWQNKVHEQIVGISTKGALPMEEEWCLYHPKTIGRQEVQNRLYENINNWG